MKHKHADLMTQELVSRGWLNNMFNSTPRRASDVVERAARAMRQLPVSQEFKDDMQLAEYILRNVSNLTHPSASTPAHAQAVQDFINHMKTLAAPAEGEQQ